MDGVMWDQLQRAMADGGTGNAEVVRDLEAMFAAFTGATYGLCVSSGTAALSSALWAVGVRPGDKVAVSVLGPSMTGLAVSAIGAEPYFVDCVSPTSFGLSANASQQAIDAGVKAAVLVPMWGYWDENPAAMDAYRLAGVPIVVDAAQAPFLRLREDLFGVADVVCLSLHGRKPLKAGEGGVCLTHDGELARRIVALRNFGQSTTFTGTRLDPFGPFGEKFGVNLKINALGAAWCLTQLTNVDALRARLDSLRSIALETFHCTQVPWLEASQSPDAQEHGRYGVVAICSTNQHASDMAAAITAAAVEVDSSRYQYSPMYTTAQFARLRRPCPNAEELTATVVACRLEAFIPKTGR